jgi:hypothetical protein
VPPTSSWMDYGRSRKLIHWRSVEQSHDPSYIAFHWWFSDHKASNISSVLSSWRPAEYVVADPRYDSVSVHVEFMQCGSGNYVRKCLPNRFCFPLLILSSNGPGSLPSTNPGQLQHGQTLTVRTLFTIRNNCFPSSIGQSKGEHTPRPPTASRILFSIYAKPRYTH